MFDRRIRTSLVAISADLLLTLLRIGLALFTASAALWADAVHSAGDLVVSITLLIGLTYRIYLQSRNNEKADKKSDKLEAILSIFVSLLLLSAPFYLWSEISSSNNPAINNPSVGVIGTLVVITILLLISKLKLYVGKQTGSLALEADAHHSHMDLLTSVAVLISLVGEMIGLNIDKYVAIVIITLIAFSGIKLLFLSALSLFGFKSSQQNSYRVILVTFFRKVIDTSSSIIHNFNRVSKYIYISIGSIYLLSGFSVINIGQIGVSYFLSKPISDYIGEGLQYNLPYPLGTLQKWDDGTVLSIQIGSVVGSGARAPGENLWLQTQNQANSSDGTDYLLTGDESLMFIQIEVQYRINDVINVERNVAEINTLMEMTASNALWQSVAIEHQSNFVGHRYSDFNAKVSSKIQHSLANLSVPGTNRNFKRHDQTTTTPRWVSKCI